MIVFYVLYCDGVLQPTEEAPKSQLDQLKCEVEKQVTTSSQVARENDNNIMTIDVIAWNEQASFELNCI